MLAPYSKHLLYWGRLRVLLPSRRTCLSLPVPEEGPECPPARQTHTDAGTEALRLLAHVTLMQTLVTSLLPMYCYFPSLLPHTHPPNTDQQAIYFQQRAYDLSLMFITHGNGKAEDNQEGLNFMGSPLINRGAAQMQGQGFLVVMLVPCPNLHCVCVSMSQEE